MPNEPHEMNICRVCGYASDTPPWGPDGTLASFDICPCCGVEWGYEDSLPEGAIAYRKVWLKEGAHWNSKYEPHDGLTTEARLARVPAQHR